MIKFFHISKFHKKNFQLVDYGTNTLVWNLRYDPSQHRYTTALYRLFLCQTKAGGEDDEVKEIPVEQIKTETDKKKETMKELIAKVSTVCQRSLNPF